MKAVFVCLLVGVVFVTGCKVGEKNCERVDNGSCGNACCKMEYEFDMSPASLVRDLIRVIGTGGPDQRYALQTTAEGTYGFTDLREFNLTSTNGRAVAYLGQAVHTTGPLGIECVFHDTVNFLVNFGDADGSCVLTAFSISEIAGALGDDGQNFYNIKTVIDALPPYAKESRLLGCPLPGTEA
mmetsp:Transcript_26687/g.74603  ORF Transcript_26687/g.74603 Transcript_26687/m.74603 type:complete len:183 (+) Transcript_26687:45-593(+)